MRKGSAGAGLAAWLLVATLAACGSSSATAPTVKTVTLVGGVQSEVN